MKKILALSLLFSSIQPLTAGKSATTTPSLVQEIEADLATLKTPATAAPSTTSAAKSKKQTAAPATTLPQPSKIQQSSAKPAPKKPAIKIAKRPSALPLVPSSINPNIQVINISAHNFSVFTTSSAEAGPGQYGQTVLPVDSYSSATLPLTNQSQRFVAAQVSIDDTMGDAGLPTNSIPINLKTPWAIVTTKKIAGEDNGEMQYLPALEQNGVILINPSSNTYTVKVMNMFAEQIDVENNGAQNPAYMILNITLPALSTVPLPVITNNNIRLHIEYPANDQVTKVNYPTDAGFYVIQEKLLEEMPRNALRNNDYNSGTNSYLYLQQIDA